MKEVYKFRVGVKPLPGPIEALCKLGVSEPHKKRINHACFLIGVDLFEYGPFGFKRHNGAGRDSSYDWDKLGNKVNGTTYVTPNKLEDAIISSGNWKAVLTGSGGYHVMDHNCHHFVKFCLEQVGAGFFYDGYDQPLLDVF